MPMFTVHLELIQVERGTVEIEAKDFDEAIALANQESDSEISYHYAVNPIRHVTAVQSTNGILLVGV